MSNHPNLDLIDRFFAAYASRNDTGLRNVLAEHATWTFPGQNPLSGTKAGIDEIVAFFDSMGNVIGSSQPSVEKLVLGANDAYVIECQHIRTNREAGPNLDQQICVLWTIEHGLIVAGQHLVADQHALDRFFKAVLS